MLNEQERDALLADLPAVAVTKELIEGKISFCQFFHHDTTTIAVLTMRNGYAIVGKAGCVSADNFNAELGERLAYDDAFDQCYKLERYLLKEALFQQQKKAA